MGRSQTGGPSRPQKEYGSRRHRVHQLTVVERVFPAEKCEKTDPHYDSVRPQQIFVQERIEQLHDALKKADVIYVVEDHSIGYSRSNYYAADLALNELALTHIKENAIVMHPMPRGQEMDPAIDKDPRVRIWQQARYSLPVAMALLERIILD